MLLHNFINGARKTPSFMTVIEGPNKGLSNRILLFYMSQKLPLKAISSEAQKLSEDN